MVMSVVAQLGSVSVQSNTLVALDGATDFLSENNVVLSLSVTTTSPTDAVLLVINLNGAATLAGQQSTFTLFRNGNELHPGKIMAKVDHPSVTEAQSASFTYMDMPNAAGTFLYTIRGRGYGVVSINKLNRQLAALIIPSSIPSNAITLGTATTISSTTYTNFGLSTSITPASITDRVLISASFSPDPSAVSKFGAKFALYRNEGQVGATPMQALKLTGPSENRMFTMFFLDEPGTTNAVSYSVRAMKYASDYGSFEICEIGAKTAHLNVMSVPSASSAASTAVNELTVSSSSWATLGLSVTITPISNTAQVLVTLNINYRADQVGSRGAFTLFRGTTNLGDATNGLQIVQTQVDDLNQCVSMTYLDFPTTTNPVTYTVQAKSLVSATSFKVSHNELIRQIGAVVTDVAITDCSTGSCTFTGDVILSSNAIFKRLRLSTLFTLTFSLTMPTQGVGNTDIFELRDTVTGNRLLKMNRASNLNTGWSYNGFSIIASGMPMIAGSVDHTPNTVTTFTITIQMGTIHILSSNQGQTFQTSINNVDTTGRLYDLLLFNSVDVSLAGTFSKIGITGERSLCILLFYIFSNNVNVYAFGSYPIPAYGSANGDTVGSPHYQTHGHP